MPVRSNRHPKKRTPTKYLFIVGGVMSGVGKGITASSIAHLLQARGLVVTAIKIDPYINVDAGTMNPTEHGEVFVLNDGLETDQDMGNYERFLNIDIPGINYMTTGSVYQEVIRRERALEYRGKNVEVVPDIPLEVIRRIKTAGVTAQADIVITEIGGTVGEYQNILFLEAVRMMKNEMPHSVATILVSYLPVPGSIGEMKTKPTQYAARTLNSAGVFADMIVARAPVALDQKRKEKIATFCNVPAGHVISAPDVDSIYDIPLNFEKDGLSRKLCDILSIMHSRVDADLRAWKAFVSKSKHTTGKVRIAVVGKYFNSGDFVLSDVYLSVLESIKYAAYHQGLKAEIDYLPSVAFEQGTALSTLNTYDGVLVPGGFGTTGIAGILKVIQYVREHRIPYFGICYGMQLAVIEYARTIMKYKDAATAETDPASTHLVIDVMPEQKEKIATQNMGGSMRLGEYPAVLKKGSIARSAYKADQISERHRHRYEVSPLYVEQLATAGIIFSGTSPDGRLMEIMELPQEKHPFFVGVQFHPEFHSRPLAPHPLFMAFIKASKASQKNVF